MPEGDTIHTLALALSRGLIGHRLIAVRVRGRHQPHLAGRRIAAVTSRGKHLFIDLDDGLSLRSHLGLHGSWHHYARAEPWQRPGRQASLVLEVEDRVYVCFSAREVELMRTQGLRTQDLRDRLGPDLTREPCDPDRIWNRALELLPGDTLIVDLLLDQRIAAGIGNIYKSEVLFVTRRSPLARLHDLPPRDFQELYRTAGGLLNGNLTGGPRRTRPQGDGRGLLWVYGRATRPCLVCSTPVSRARLGVNPRSTYWCPACQAAAPAGM
ncbi:MAG TPA: DNA-formamidopyrimidine glycosylase family protein [Lamprocystis sp. (in: g-proteobacteria)]|nr:DNA-formamidopyrimidine glycosylase family protein [Lamprocystis sp. (in: g-proteobacteria)]